MWVPTLDGQNRTPVSSWVNPSRSPSTHQSGAGSEFLKPNSFFPPNDSSHNASLQLSLPLLYELPTKPGGLSLFKLKRLV